MNTTELQRIKQRYNIVGNSDGLNHALDVALQVAPTDLSVLIVGESGVGKEIIPRLIHDNSPRRREKYFAINCGSIPEGTIDSELFGHEKGSFTGAVGESEGYFGIANKGTIFLDEVGELPMATQARLLRVLETGEYIRVGGTKIMKTDVRIVAATNVNISKAIREGRFREDLYYRLNTIPIQMPPLRDRGQDILLLFRLFAMQMAEKYRLPKISLTDEAKQLMLGYKWPGNVRQLKNITEQMSVLSPSREISGEILSRYIPHDPESTELAPVGKGGSHSYENERELLYKILYELRGNVSDLRRDMSSLRKQIDEARGLNGATGFQNPIIAPTDHGMTGLQPPALQPQPLDAEAELIEAEEENGDLNLTSLGRQMVEKALRMANGNRKKAATALGISDRTLYRRIKQYGL
ncbi:sigma-54-dependent Fis family transcriptional regulator [Prevotella sp. KH2C16]|uniref:sigma-54 interaction domain-containing protein n=1 Tax=Prevotella sp. KH2C16 TaxID=1855325 RepID=UPI0008F2232B|nr:sigma-54 dependent transcriptional regulator [Prevotella sp. KH2C16]SFG63049.1 regulatory protein, Fis family [Prevotella sp. KH2C16]